MTPTSKATQGPPSSLSLFDQAAAEVSPPPPLASTSGEAWAHLREHLSRIQVEILRAYRELGPMTDEELVGLERFKGYGDSTLRGRRAELVRFELVERLDFGATAKGNRCGRYALAQAAPRSPESDAEAGGLRP